MSGPISSAAATFSNNNIASRAHLYLWRKLTDDDMDERLMLGNAFHWMLERWTSKISEWKSVQSSCCASSFFSTIFVWITFSLWYILVYLKKKHFLEIWVMSAFRFYFLWEEVLWHFGKLFQRQVRGAGCWCGRFVSVEATVLNNVQHIFFVSYSYNMKTATPRPLLLLKNGILTSVSAEAGWKCN